MGALYTYDVTVDWTGADERGTESYTAYSRDHELRPQATVRSFAADSSIC